MEPRKHRRYVILAEGKFGETSSKTAIGVIRYGRDTVVAIIDSTKPGRNAGEWLGGAVDIPIVADLADALPLRPDSLLIGIAPAGGKLPAAWRAIILAAIAAGMDIVNGLHEFISEDPELTAAAAAHGVALIDHRRPPERHEVATGRPHPPGKRVILTVGSDCASGKMTVTLELRRAALAAGLDPVFVPTGQTGIMIEGWGVAIDRVVSDFVAGTVEWMVDQAYGMGDWILVEGQGSIDHPAYSGVTMSLLHGTQPHAMVMVHHPTRELHHGFEAYGAQWNAHVKGVAALIPVYESIAALVAPSRVLAIALNTSGMAEGDARRLLAATEAETGLVTDDPVRYGAERILDALRAGLEHLP